MNARNVLAKRKHERYFNAVERAARASDAVDRRIAYLCRHDSMLKRLLIESDAAEKQVKELRG